MNWSRHARASMRRRILATLGSVVIAMSALVAVPAFAAPTAPVERTAAPVATARAALSGSQFNAGYIIADELFYQRNAMTQAQIQAFLDAQVGTCSNANCLNVLYAKTEKKSPDRGICEGYTPDSDATEKASTIIFKVQQSCGISARVILVTLQKEQGLITHRSPTTGRLAAAMGWLCPDTAPCNGAAASFFRQIYGGAWQLKRYNTPDYFGNYHIGTYQIRYSPNSCGTKTVTIRNHATAALYNYTPYTPNAAALNNLRGSAPPCGSYGNRNFWVFYNDWFGNPLAGAGANAISAAWNAAGGVTGSWGNRMSGPTCLTGSSCAHLFEHAVAYWTAGSGLFVASGAMGDWVLPRIGSLGYPSSHPVSVTENGGGTAQAFTKGLVNMGPTATVLLTGATRTEHSVLGGVRGPVGWGVAGKTCTLAGGACVTEFQAGYIFEIKSVAKSVAQPEIYALYKSQGGAAGPLKLPTSSAIPLTVNGGGTQQAFQGGLVNTTGPASTFTLTGLMRTAHGRAGGVGGAMGWPTGAQVCGLPQAGCSQSFQHGAIYLKGSIAKFISNDAIAAYHATSGGPAGSLGYPTTDTIVMSASAGQYTQAFEKGLVYSSAGGTFSLSGAIRTAHGKLGGVNGKSGWPVAEQDCSLPGGGCSQKFERGTIYVANPLAVPRYMPDGAIATYYASNGGPAGVLGWPVTDQVSSPKNGGGFAQGFTGGLVNAGPAGAFLETDPIRAKHAKAGGVGGYLGWPIGERVCGLPGGECSQQFQHGVLYTLH